MLSSVAACGSTSAGDGGSTGSSDKKVELTVWSWDSTLPRTVKGFEAKNPNIKVKVTNAGTNKDEYNALSNAIEAGSGAPDIAQIEYYALPEYVIRGHLENLSDLGASDFKDFYTPGTWSSVNINDGVYALPMDSGPMAWFYNKGVFDKTSGYSDFYTPGPWASVQFAGKVYGLPMDSGPMAFFYNKEVFDKAGVDAEQIKTWDQYYDAAKKIHALGDNYYITSDTGDAGFFDSMTWLAGAKPFQTSSDGSEVTVNLTEDKGVKTFTDFWQKLLDEGLLDTKTAGWSEDWFKGMVDGTIASLFTGAWMPANLANSAADGAGKWRVTQMPTADGSTTNSENGGSSLAVLASTKKADAAYQFIEYANHGDGVATRVAGGAFPADKASMESDSFKNTTTVKNADGEDVDYFGGQKYNEVLAQAAENVSSDYQFLPYEVKARTIFGDYLGKSYTGDQKLTDGIAAWQKALQDYGKDQGFTVK
ncbi:ABC transporter substrate-binding protein [Bifidobacterium longum]|uniref:ABC transporter substrate-binding protein n=1 Tax=Bifidobacterium longum TaxID=216816 RepID=UPI003BFA78BF